MKGKTKTVNGKTNWGLNGEISKGFRVGPAPKLLRYGFDYVWGSDLRPIFLDAHGKLRDESDRSRLLESEARKIA